MEVLSLNLRVIIMHLVTLPLCIGSLYGMIYTDGLNSRMKRSPQLQDLTENIKDTLSWGANRMSMTQKEASEWCIANKKQLLVQLSPPSYRDVGDLMARDSMMDTWLALHKLDSRQDPGNAPLCTLLSPDGSFVQESCFEQQEFVCISMKDRNYEYCAIGTINCAGDVCMTVNGERKEANWFQATTLCGLNDKGHILLEAILNNSTILDCVRYHANIGASLWVSQSEVSWEWRLKNNAEDTLTVPAVYLNWAIDQPSKHMKDCVKVSWSQNSKKHEWYDVDCDEKYPFICGQFLEGGPGDAGWSSPTDTEENIFSLELLLYIVIPAATVLIIVSIVTTVCCLVRRRNAKQINQNIKGETPPGGTTIVGNHYGDSVSIKSEYETLDESQIDLTLMTPEMFAEVKDTEHAQEDLADGYERLGSSERNEYAHNFVQHPPVLKEDSGFSQEGAGVQTEGGEEEIKEINEVAQN